MNNFWDNFLDNAKKVASKASKKTEDIVGVSKLKVEALKTENAIKSMYEKLGNATYSMVKEDYKNEDLISCFVDEIDDLYDQLDELKEQIASLKNTVICPVCKATNGVDSYFCNKCGASLTEDLPDDEESCCANCQCTDDCSDCQCDDSCDECKCENDDTREANEPCTCCCGEDEEPCTCCCEDDKEEPCTCGCEDDKEEPCTCGCEDDKEEPCTCGCEDDKKEPCTCCCEEPKEAAPVDETEKMADEVIQDTLA